MMPFNGSNTVDLVLNPIKLINQTKINTCQQWGQFLKNMGGEEHGCGLFAAGFSQGKWGDARTVLVNAADLHQMLKQINYQA